MAVELIMGYATSSEVQKEAASGFENVDKLIQLLSKSHHNQAQAQIPSPAQLRSPSVELQMDCTAVADMAVNKFRRVISLLSRTRTGHARFRRGPVPISSWLSGSRPESFSDTKVYCPTPIQQVPPSVDQSKFVDSVETWRDSVSKNITFSCSPEISLGNSFVSSLTGDGDGRLPSSSSAFQITDFSQVSPRQGKPPLSSCSLKRKCNSSDHAASGKCSGSYGRCHCSKKRKLRLKRAIRVPAISTKMSDIPPDDYSWRKYGQKPIKGSPHPRGYYKCSSVKGCPARKHVEKALDDPGMLIVTYEGEHNHSISVAETSGLILESS